MITVNKPIDITTESYPKCPYTNIFCDPNILYNDYSISKKDKCLTCEHWRTNYDYILNKSLEDARKNKKSNYNVIVNEVNMDGGKYIKFDNNDIGFLICATSTIEDYYYVYMDKDKNIKMSSCVGGYEVIKPSEIPQNLAVLSYIRKHDKLYIKEIITRYVKNLKYDKVITKIFY